MWRKERKNLEEARDLKSAGRLGSMKESSVRERRRGLLFLLTSLLLFSKRERRKEGKRSSHPNSLTSTLK